MVHLIRIKLQYLTFSVFVTIDYIPCKHSSAALGMSCLIGALDQCPETRISAPFTAFIWDILSSTSISKVSGNLILTHVYSAILTNFGD